MRGETIDFSINQLGQHGGKIQWILISKHIKESILDIVYTTDKGGLLYKNI